MAAPGMPFQASTSRSAPAAQWQTWTMSLCAGYLPISQVSWQRLYMNVWWMGKTWWWICAIKTASIKHQIGGIHEHQWHGIASSFSNRYWWTPQEVVGHRAVSWCPSTSNLACSRRCAGCPITASRVLIQPSVHPVRLLTTSRIHSLAQYWRRVFPEVRGCRHAVPLVGQTGSCQRTVVLWARMVLLRFVLNNSILKAELLRHKAELDSLCGHSWVDPDWRTSLPPLILL